MEIKKLDERLARAEKILAEVAQGNFDENIELKETGDPLYNLEMGINFLIMDLRDMDTANKEKTERLMENQAELEEKLVTIEQQQIAIRELSTPIMEVWDDVLVLPIVGVLDTKRSMDIMNSLLSAIVSMQAKCIILDITGVEIVETKTADCLMKVAQAARLLGVHCVLTGINPAVAQTLVEIGADLSMVKTLRNLKAGLMECINTLRQNNQNRTKD